MDAQPGTFSQLGLQIAVIQDLPALFRASQAALALKCPPANAGDARDAGSIPALGRSPRGHGNPLQCSCLKHPMDRGARHDRKDSDTTETTYHAYTGLLESGCRLSAQFGDGYTVNSLCCFYFSSFNDRTLKSNQMILD